ncbi:purine nucleoside phosphorylase [Xylona heveae TC161]|uniref:Purine nucleoside phosphorylase n=1 Tax=Xylona heveae (strain CBS 132557 / TC161) TaxID=1328760 RepID=A0A165FNY9_XYLHT|nr:purine nucleoside phosphorylase [Xylona heveae TC161]KZF21207.1 purine nucleoside phosphorylase [Xylona heveae TC161]
MGEIAPANIYLKANETAQFLRERLPEPLKSPRVAIVCGSGLGSLVQTLHPEPLFAIDYHSIPYFPISTVAGHAGQLVAGFLGNTNTPCVLMVGRFHFYEGHSLEKVTFPARVFKCLGIDTIILTNAAGGLNPDYAVGDIVVINDHLNLAGLAGVHPLRGPNADEFGIRFLPLSDAYDLELRREAHRAWSQLGPDRRRRRIHEGVYAYVCGPTYETRAECRMLRRLGADVVGMSTVPEIVVARHCGLRVLAMSLVTNTAVLDPGPRGDDFHLDETSSEELHKVMEKGMANHEEVIEASHHASLVMQELVRHCVDDLSIKAGEVKG